MAEIKLSAKESPSYPPIRATGLSVQALFARGREWWCQGAKYRDDTGRAVDISDISAIRGDNRAMSFDILGAIDYCYAGNEDNQTARIRVGLALSTTATRWNDAPGRTWEDVIELVRKVNN